MTATKLLTVQFLLHGLLALLLLFMPRLTIRAVGWPTADNAFWPRLLGGMLLGIALATLATLAGWTTNGIGAGIGLAAEIIINLTTAFVLLSIWFLGPAHPTLRGSFFSTALAIGMILLALIEVAYV
jgi:hypothetical protein